jgi:hypothetical protein
MDAVVEANYFAASAGEAGFAVGAGRTREGRN